jgi:tRNA A-37 threonylcarbamoyl transferase component Bud32
MAEPPAGFVVRATGAVTFVAAEDELAALEQAGLATVGGWRATRPEPGGSGRGRTTCLVLSTGTRVRLKQLLRGGTLASLWRQRFVGTGRLIRNVELPHAARERGLATPRVVALLVVAGPPGLYRGWLAVENVDDAIDLRRRVASARPPARDEWSTVMELVRLMHDHGLEHRDLNLGNLLLAPAKDGIPRAFVIDLDDARLHDGPLTFRARLAGLRRLERSYVKTAGAAEASETVRRELYELYAAGDSRLAARLERGRRAGRLWILIHRFGWMLSSPPS